MLDTKKCLEDLVDAQLESGSQGFTREIHDDTRSATLAILLSIPGVVGDVMEYIDKETDFEYDSDENYPHPNPIDYIWVWFHDTLNDTLKEREDE